MPLLAAFQTLYPSAWLYALRGLALAAQARAAEGDDARRSAVRARRGDAVAGRTRRGRAGQLPAPAAAARRRAGLGDRGLPGGHAGLRRGAARGLAAPATVAPGADRRTRGALPARPRPRARRPRASRAARREYLAWGATAKVDQLDWAYPALRLDHEAPSGPQAAPPDRRSTLTTGTIDLLGILSASRALSSETSIDRLHARVVEVLGNMTGATGVHLVLWSDERQSWLVPARSRRGLSTRRALPLSVLRYVQRTREPLLVGDATADDRFARDPYFAAAGVCSLLGCADPHPRHAGSGAAAREPSRPRRLQPRTARERQADRRTARRLARQRPGQRGVPPDRRGPSGAAARRRPGRQRRRAPASCSRPSRRRSGRCSARTSRC